MNVVPASYRGFRALVVLGVVLACAALVGAAVLAGTWEQAFAWGRELVLQLRDTWRN